jgi:ATP-binding cassette subfamily F protein 3
LGIHRGQFKKIQGQTDKYYECLLEEEELYEKTQLNQEKKIKKMEAFIERFKAKASKAKQAQSRLKALNKMTVLEKLEDLEEWDFSFPYHPCPGKVLLQAQQISFGFGHHQNPHHPTDWIIRQFSITCYQKDRIGIIGRNGKGKSTLLRLLAGEYQPQEGRLTTHPQLQTSYFGQTNIKNFDPEQTVLEEIQNTRPDLPIKTLRAVCGHVLFSGDEALKKMKVLSGGEQSRVMLGKMLLTPSSLLFLDEPSHHLDMESIEKLTQALEDFPGAVILVSHDEELLKRVCHRLYLFIHDDIIEYPRSYESFEEEGGWDEWEKKSSAPAALPLEKKEKHSYELQKRKQQELQKFKKMLIQLEQHIQQTESTLQTLDHQIAHHDPEKLSADISWSSYGQQRQDLMDQLEKSYQEWENLSKKIEECT